MKYKILSCLLAVSAMLSVQPITIINSSCTKITLDTFGSEEEKNCIINHDHPILLAAHKSIIIDKEISFMRIAIYEGSYQLRNLTSNTKVIIVESDEQFELLTTDDSVEIQELY